jgi:LysM repeat protein
MDRVQGYGHDLQEPVYRFPFYLFIVLALLLGGLFLVSMARASENPCGEFYTIAPGDDLSRIAVECDTSVPALLAANPEVEQDEPLIPGQILTIPANDIILDTGVPTTTYTVVAGDTLSGIATRYSTTVTLLHQANPQITDPNLIYPGQVLVIPGPPGVSPSDPVIPDTGAGEQIYTVQPGDILSRIASRYGRTTAALVQRNPHIADPDLIYPGQSIIIPAPFPPTGTDPNIIPDTGAGELLYTVQRGDTLSEIALRHGIPAANLIQRNAQIANPDLIYPGQLVVIPGTLPPPTPLPPEPEPPTIVFPTPVPTPTPPAPDPDIIPETGEIIFQEDFSLPGDWLTAVEVNFRMEYAEGGYRILNHTAFSTVTSVRALDFADIYLETNAARVGGPQTGFYGVVCRWQDTQNFYAMVIGSDGFYSIARVLNGQLTHLAEGRSTNGPILLDSANNRISGSCLGNTLTLFVNGEQLLQAQDNTFASGSVGLMVGTRTAAGTHVHFDNFALRR